MRIGGLKKNMQNSSSYNSQQRGVEPQISARNAPNHSLFMAGMPGQQVPLQEMPLNENLQKSGETGIERHNSFALYGKRNGTSNNSKAQQNGFAAVKRDQNGETLPPREPNETTIMKARPSTSFRVANKNYNTQNPNNHFQVQKKSF